MDRLILSSLFSREYTLQGTVMISSFLHYHPGAIVKILALDMETNRFLKSYFGNQIEVVCLSENSELNEAFIAFSRNRTAAEAIFTLKVHWINRILRLSSDGKKILYADSDLYFLARIQDFDTSNWSILLSPHNFPPERTYLNSGGLYNAGCVGIHANTESRKLISWWEERVTEYCGLSKVGGLYADQKYLDFFSRIGNGVKAFSHGATNVGMWQVCSSRRLKMVRGSFFIGNETVNSFHFHGLRIFNSYVRKGMLRYGFPLASGFSAFRLYKQYILELSNVFNSQAFFDLSIFSHSLSRRSELRDKFVHPLLVLDISFLKRRNGRIFSNV